MSWFRRVVWSTAAFLILVGAWFIRIWVELFQGFGLLSFRDSFPPF